MGKRSTFSRVERDNHETPTSAVRSLREWREPRTRFVEPCIGVGSLSKRKQRKRRKHEQVKRDG
jgi:hypothetical protein